MSQDLTGPGSLKLRCLNPAYTEWCSSGARFRDRKSAVVHFANNAHIEVFVVDKQRKFPPRHDRIQRPVTGIECHASLGVLATC